MLTKPVLTSPAVRRLPIVALIALLAMTGLVGVALGAAAPSAVALSATAPSATSATDDPLGVDLSVKVLGPAGSSSPAAPAVPGVPPRTTAPQPVKPAPVRGVTQTTIVGSAAGTHALGIDPISVSGVFYVSGVTAIPKPDLGPGGGDIVLAFTLKNVTTTPVTSSLKFWITNAVGMQLAAVDAVEVADLAPGETRTVTATLPDVGQWTVFTGHVTLTPPTEVLGTALGPVSRESLVVIPPYFLLLAFTAAGAVTLGLRKLPVVRRARNPVIVEGVAS